MALSMVDRPADKKEASPWHLENISDHEMVFVTVEFKDSANKPIALPPGVTAQSV
jgi:hypothetical protein